MANDLNQCNFIGRLGRDPEVKSLSNGQSVASFSIACGEQWKDKSTGSKQEKTEWVNVVAWGRLGEIVGQYLSKGSQVFISGKMQTRKWQDQSGADRYTTEIVANQMQMLDGKAGAQNGGHSGQSNNAQAQSSSGPVDDLDSDIPF